tara:strand:- start:456 stop:1043 length:588 start_codon:yes stop_codon:yes gene_type:complete
MLVFIDRQHAGKPNKINDRGASRDINGDGEITSEELEAIWTARIAISLEIKLLDMGINVMPISDGRYSERHERVNKYADMHPGPWVYLAMHLNAGGGDYGAFFYDHRSSNGQQLATIMATQLNGDVEEIEKAKAIEARKDNWTKNAFYTIRSVGRPVAICVEPFFMDTHQSLLSMQGVFKVASSMAIALRKWRDR